MKGTPCLYVKPMAKPGYACLCCSGMPSQGAVRRRDRINGQKGSTCEGGTSHSLCPLASPPGMRKKIPKAALLEIALLII